MKTLGMFTVAAVLLAVAAVQLSRVTLHAAEPPADASQMKMLSGDMNKDMSMMNDMMFQHLGGKDEGYEKRFIDMMIPHHEGAVLMAKDALKNATRPELRQMAQDIITSQEKEITKLKQWRKEWYGK